MAKETVYTRLADIPGVGYETPPGIDRRTLPNHDLRPDISTYNFEGKIRISVMWDAGNGVSTSQSPALGWANSGYHEPLWTDALRKLLEALELPGSASDYHIAIRQACSQLWDMRRQDPDILAELERLYLLDLRLAEIIPELVRLPEEYMPYSVSLPSTRHLIRIYEREGFIAEALEIARRGVALGEDPDEVQRLEACLSELEAEDVA